MILVALGLGLVLIIEGLALVLAPSHLDRALAMLAAMPGETRRRLGLAMIAVGAGLLMLWRLLGGA